ncbi:MAG: CoA-binding protein, partial [Chloroflexi bacterium]|nr:CoA-binding protein [Chloroflexota bacterium]
MSIESDILNSFKTVAIVGLSSNPDRASFRVGSYLKDKGYKVIPVNPKKKEILGLISYPDLKSIPVPIQVVDIFRRSTEVEPIVQEAVQAGVSAVWMQEGIINEEAAELARKAGLLVVMNKCM